MNLRFDRKGTIGQILTSFPSLIFVFVIMLIFVIVSGFISKQHSEKYSLLEDFLDDWIELNGKIVRVSDAIIPDFYIRGNPVLKGVLREHFIEKYGSGNSFALIFHSWSEVPERYILSSWAGSFEDKVNLEDSSISVSEFKNFFNRGLKNVYWRSHNGFDVYIKDGSENES